VTYLSREVALIFSLLLFYQPINPNPWQLLKAEVVETIGGPATNKYISLYLKVHRCREWGELNDTTQYNN
jgi:hypothetical protein